MVKKLFILVFLQLTLSVPLMAQQTLDLEYHQMLSQLLKHSVPEIEPHQVTSEAIFLDAREIEEYQVSHIPNAIHVGYDHFSIKKWHHLDKNRPLIVYCSVGYRSEKIAEKFQKKGFQNVQNLYGGIFEWKHQNKPVVKNNKITDSIHTFNKEWSKWLKKGIKIY